uniref:DUF4806 domain-containing protein n=1 Tax=Strongyloides papillosus TaxID=174720 RepID=A0A0N5BUP4_STREA
MPSKVEPFELSSDESDGNNSQDGSQSNSQRRKRPSKSPNHHKDYIQGDEYETAITGAITSDKVATRNALKQPTLSHPVRLRQNNSIQGEKENNPIPSFITQTSNLSSGSQSQSVLISQESTAMQLLSLKLDSIHDNMKMWFEDKMKTHLDTALSDHYAKIKTLIEDNFLLESKASDERVNGIISALENLSIQPPTKRKPSNKNADSDKTTGTWLVMVGEETRPLYLVSEDVMNVVVAKAREHLVSVNRAPDTKLRQFLDMHIDIGTVIKRLGHPYKFGLTVADYLFPKEVQIAYKFHNALTRSSKRQPLPDDKMKKYKQALMYCGMSSFYSKEERRVYFSTVVEALNGRASHWASGSQRKSYNDEIPTYWKVSDFS